MRALGRPFASAVGGAVQSLSVTDSAYALTFLCATLAPTVLTVPLLFAPSPGPGVPSVRVSSSAGGAFAVRSRRHPGARISEGAAYAGWDVFWITPADARSLGQNVTVTVTVTA